MDIEELYRYAYVKRPLHTVYADPSEVPQEFLLEWFKDAFDRERVHSEGEMKDGLSATPAAILEWLEEAAALAWSAKTLWLGQWTRHRDEARDRSAAAASSVPPLFLREK